MNISREHVVSNIVDAGLTREFMDALGWQGGTVHQVADEILKRRYQYLPVREALRRFKVVPSHCICGRLRTECVAGFAKNLNTMHGDKAVQS